MSHIEDFHHQHTFWYQLTVYHALWKMSCRGFPSPMVWGRKELSKMLSGKTYCNSLYMPSPALWWLQGVLCHWHSYITLGGIRLALWGLFTWDVISTVSGANKAITSILYCVESFITAWEAQVPGTGKPGISQYYTGFLQPLHWKGLMLWLTVHCAECSVGKGIHRALTPSPLVPWWQYRELIWAATHYAYFIPTVDHYITAPCTCV